MAALIPPWKLSGATNAAMEMRVGIFRFHCLIEAVGRNRFRLFANRDIAPPQSLFVEITRRRRRHEFFRFA